MRRRPSGAMLHPDQKATLSDLLVSWQRALSAENKSRNTLFSYRKSVHAFDVFLTSQGHSRMIADVRREDCEKFISDGLATLKPSTVATRYTVLKIFLGWCVEEGELKVNPMERMRHPHPPPSPSPIITDEHIRALLKACAGNSFEQRRDTAIILLLLATGMRRAEVANLQCADVDLDEMTVQTTIKGGRLHIFPIGKRARAAIDRYLRSRVQHHWAGSPHLWLGHRGAFGYSGVYNMLQHRAEQAGIGHIWPHLFRHTFAHRWLAADGSEGALMSVIGWRNRAMIDHYGRSLREKRARDEYHRLEPGDQF